MLQGSFAGRERVVLGRFHPRIPGILEDICPVVHPDQEVKRIVLRDPYDAHCHLREDDMLLKVLRFSVERCAYVLAMPNLKKAILTIHQAIEYLQRIQYALRLLGLEKVLCQFIMTIQITPLTRPELIREAVRIADELGIRLAFKAYPYLVTTQSEHGLPTEAYFGLVLVWRELERINAERAAAGLWKIPLLLHPEHPHPAIPGLDKEWCFVDQILTWLVEKFPLLPIVAEHISDRRTVAFVLAQSPLIAATLTPQHCMLTLDDVIGYSPRTNFKGCPHHLCKPTLKFIEDIEMILRAVFSGTTQIFMGSDSAPHSIENKEGEETACGNWTSPNLLEILAWQFAEYGQLRHLQGFVSDNGRVYYGLPSLGREVVLTKNAWQVPAEYDGIRPYWKNQEMAWQIESNN